jgi:hypothetical protein
MKEEIKIEAAQFTEKEYINGIFIAVNTFLLSYTLSLPS